MIIYCLQDRQNDYKRDPYNNTGSKNPVLAYICEIYMKEYRGNLFKSYYIFYHQNENSSKNCSKSADPESASNSIPAFLVDLLPNETYYVENIKSTNFILGTNTKSMNL
jgi:hypothetical protein